MQTVRTTMTHHGAKLLTPTAFSVFLIVTLSISAILIGNKDVASVSLQQTTATVSAIFTAIVTTFVSFVIAPLKLFSRRNSAASPTEGDTTSKAPPTAGRSTRNSKKQTGEKQNDTAIPIIHSKASAVKGEGEVADEAEDLTSTDSINPFSLGQFLRVAGETLVFLFVLVPIACFQLLCLGTLILGWNLAAMVAALISTPPMALIYTILVMSVTYGIVSSTVSSSLHVWSGSWSVSELLLQFAFMFSWIFVLMTSFTQLYNAHIVLVEDMADLDTAVLEAVMADVL